MIATCRKPDLPLALLPIVLTFEDYSGGMTREALIVFTTCLSYGAAATGLFAIAKIAL